MNTEILEGNKLIAAFMGKPDHIMPELLKYHSSWDWLMPACRKFDSLFDSNWTETQELEYVALSDKMDEAATFYEIFPLYQELVNGIKWYNQTKQS